MKPKVNDIQLPMELDTGSAVSVMPKRQFEETFPSVKLENVDISFKTYTGEKIIPLGVAKVTVNYDDQCFDNMNLYVVPKGSSPLLGREWLRKLTVDWSKLSLPRKEIHTVETDKKKVSEEIKAMTEKYKDIFDDKTGTVKGIKAKLTLKEGSTPVFCKARTVAFALKPKVDAELDRLEAEGTITKVSHSNWATPIVPVLKKSGQVRICGDFRITVNPCLQVDEYPLPNIDHIFANLGEGQHFSKIDLRQAYLHLEVDEDSKEYISINTQKGLYRYNKLAFGIASAPAIWQRTIEQVLLGLPGVQCLLDDMIITGKTDEEHLANLEGVLKRLSEYGLKINLKKCDFFKDSITFCGHIVDKHGLHKQPDKIEAMINAPRPKDVPQLRAFLGLVNYYRKFLPDLATILSPLFQLLKKDNYFKWTKSCPVSFNRIKELVSSKCVLTHYDPKKEIKLAYDASSYGLGAVISHVMSDGKERPIAFASRTLTKAETNYSHIDKETLGIIWGIKKFHSYLYGRSFTLVTHNQPLSYIFNPKKGISVTASARLQRCAIILAGYDYKIEFRKTSKHANADSLSHLPLKVEEETVSTDMGINALNTAQVDSLPVTTSSVQQETRRDPVISTVVQYTNYGWPTEKFNQELNAFYTRRHELTVHQECLMWGLRVVIPAKLRQDVLDQVHEGHVGVVKMKMLARSYIWWPGIDGDIETLAKQCTGCQQSQHMPKSAPIHPWEWPSKPWERIHIDFAGPFLGYMFLIIVDSHSKWPEVIKMTTGNTSASSTVEVLRTVFVRNGIAFQNCQ
ncbi:hypothetical protein SNE40_018385 [Patella caerulea]|uniref:Reverse transcriptase domain-containing protein n=1 Tax=Patella caerulea TaxID=87958 RepID=A0AAN8JAC7_PATCE